MRRSTSCLPLYLTAHNLPQSVTYNANVYVCVCVCVCAYCVCVRLHTCVCVCAYVCVCVWVGVGGCGCWWVGGWVLTEVGRGSLRHSALPWLRSSDALHASTRQRARTSRRYFSRRSLQVKRERRGRADSRWRC
jgi:hypothetical protein